MGEFLSKLLDIAIGEKAKKFWSIIIIVAIAVLILFPYIDANILAHNRLSQRISVLEQLSKLDIERIESVPELKKEYEIILQELTKVHDNSITGVPSQPTSPEAYWYKYIGGGFLFWLVGILLIFQKTKPSGESVEHTAASKEKRKQVFNKVAGFVLCLGLGFLCATIATNIPTILNPLVNAIAFPIILLLVIAFLFGEC